MTRAPAASRQRGAALVVGMIMLVLITVMLVTAMNLSTTNFRSVTNMQFRDEAIAAANAAIQERLSSTFDDEPAPSNADIDINNDGTPDYAVTVTPTCIGANEVFDAPPSSLSLPPTMSASPVWNTTWDITAEVTDATTGANVTVSSGVRVQLSDADKAVACP